MEKDHKLMEINHRLVSLKDLKMLEKILEVKKEVKKDE